MIVESGVKHNKSNQIWYCYERKE